VTKDAKECWADVTVGRIQHDDHQATLVTAFDITDRKQAEQKLIAYQEKLQSLASDLVVTEERERRQMATFLHDSICQSLIFCKMKLEALRETKSEQETTKLVAEIDSIVDRSIDDTRTLTFELSPPILYELGFEPALQWLMEHMYHHFKLRVSLTNDGTDKPLAEDIRVVLFQSVREILINVVKHAQTYDAFVSLEKINDSIRIVIEDHGRGFDASQNTTHSPHHGGFGLFSIRERLEYLNGRMTIHSTVGFGTKVTLTAPLKHSMTEG
jgi:signal transduction histidine kinase